MSDISKARVKGVVYDIKDARSRSLVEQHELAIQEILENYARMDGYYETMGVGVATNLKGSNTSVAKFVYRKSGGSESVDSGLAQLTAMRGKSVVWNQFFDKTDFHRTTTQGGVTITNNQNGSFTISGKHDKTEGLNFIMTFSTRKFEIGHKYLLKCMPQQSSIAKFRLVDTDNIAADNGEGIIYTAITDRTFNSAFRIRCISEADAGTGMIVYPQLFDLTQMFGAGNEPSTVEEFEAMFPNGYYPYNAGSLLNFNTESLKTVGFNQWDEEWENGYLNSNGTTTYYPTIVVSKNFIPVFPSTNYYIHIPRLNGGICFYDKNKHVINYSNYTSNTFITPPRAAYMKFDCSSYYGPTYNHDICINISDPVKNGTYEPYWASNLLLNINSQTGKLNGSGDSVVVFPNGMAGMNSVQDTIIGNVATKKFNQINDLTTLPITLNYEGYFPEDEGHFCSYILELPKNGKAFTASVMNGLFNKKYSATSGISAESSNNFYIYTIQGKSYVEIMDDDFSTDARFADEEQWDALIADIRTSLADKVLLYELSNYEQYVLDGIELPLNYKVDKNGTEQIVPNTTDPDNNIPSTTPCDMDIVYSIDASGTIINLPNNYVSATQQQSFSASQQAQARENIGLSNVATKYKTTIQGDGNNEYTITHNLSSTSVFVVVQDAATLEQISSYYVVSDSANQIRIVFNEEIGVGVTYNILILS